MAAKAIPAVNPPKRRYHIVNPAGAIHEVSRDHAAQRLRLPGWRMATQAEVDLLNTERVGPNGERMAPGEQRCDAPICTPWAPDPDAQLDPDAK